MRSFERSGWGTIWTIKTSRLRSLNCCQAWPFLYETIYGVLQIQ